MIKRRAIILDRDGVLIEDKTYSYKVEELELLPGVIEGLKLLSKILFSLSLQTNLELGAVIIRLMIFLNIMIISSLS
jgi:histidinol phosphatase-like enzyme